MVKDNIDNPCTSYDVVVDTINRNGVYVNDKNVDVYEVNVDRGAKDITITENGEYKPYQYDTDYFNNVTVDVQPELQEKDVQLGYKETVEITPDTEYYGLSKVTVSTPDIPLQNKTLNVTENGSTTLMPDEGYYALHTVAVNVNIPDPELESKTVDITTNGTETITPDSAYGLSSVTVNTNVQPNLQDKTVEGDWFGQTYKVEADEGYDGLRTANVKVRDIKLENKEEYIFTNNSTVIIEPTFSALEPDVWYDGISEVRVHTQIPNSSTAVTITDNGTTTLRPDGGSYFNQVDITTNVQPALQEKSVPLGINETVEITPDTEYYGLSKVTVSTPNVPLQNKTLNVTENGSTRLMPDEGYYALHIVDVNVDVPNPELESKEVTITSNGSTNITPDSKYGLSNVTVNTNVQPALQNKTVEYTENGEYTITNDDGFYGLKQAKINVQVPNPEPNLQDKDVTITKNGSTTITKDNGYDGLGNVNVTTNVQPILENKSVTYTKNGEYLINRGVGYDGIIQAKVNVSIPNTPTAVTITQNGTTTLTPNDGYYNKVDINVDVPNPELESKTVDIDNNGSITITPDSAYGLSAVTVNTNVVPLLQVRTINITENGLKTIKKTDPYDGMYQVDVNVNVPTPEPQLESKEVTINSNGTQTITPNVGYDGISSVTINTNVQPPLQEKSVPLGINETVEITPDTEYYGLRKVTVSTPNVHLQNKTLNVTENGSTTLMPDEGYYALHQVQVNTNVQPTLQNKNVTITENGTQTITKDEGYDGLGNVTVTTNVEGSVQNNVIGSFLVTANTTSSTGTICGRVINDNVHADISNLNTSGFAVLALDEYLKNADTLIANNIRFDKNVRDNVFFYKNNLGNVKHLIAHNFRTSLTDYWSLFAGNDKIETIDLTGWADKGICGEMFSGCTNLKEVNLTNWSFNGIQHPNQMFMNCSKLQNVIIPQPLKLNNVVGANQMFYRTGNCLINGDSKITITYGTGLTNCSEMFAYNNGLTEVYMTPSKTLPYQSNGINANNIFYQTNNLEKFSLANIIVSADTRLFASSGKLKWVDLSGSRFHKNNVPSTTYGAVRISNNSEDNLVTIIGDHTLAEVENGSIKAFIEFGKGGSDVLALQHPKLRYSSLLAVLNGLYKVSGDYQLILSKTAWNNMYNDDDTRPNSSTISSRQTTLQNLATSKGWTLNKDYE